MHPLCAYPLKKKTNLISLSSDEQIENLLVKCKNLPNCEWQGNIWSYDNHFLKCDYKKEKCDFCESDIERCNMKKHKDICDYRIIDCDFCETAYQYIHGEKSQEFLPMSIL